MIRVTRLDRSQFYLNAELVQSVESTPDTHVVLMNGHSYVVRETDTEIVDAILSYRRAAYGGGVSRPPMVLVQSEAE
ncbi:MAG: flagellar protein FlbD [Chloroflexi bacterium HGW-Chloroflexi-9]|nr:MAG: flagellar protein FlbD [Chloroflexi bacterium HGW-Chloroflexi-9]